MDRGDFTAVRTRVEVRARVEIQARGPAGREDMRGAREPVARVGIGAVAKRCGEASVETRGSIGQVPEAVT